MLFFDQDPPIFFDSGLYFDDTESHPAITTKKRSMNKIRRNWTKLGIADLLAEAKIIVESNAANLDIPVPNAPYTALLAAYNATVTDQQKLIEDEQIVKTDRDRRDASWEQLIDGLLTFASYAEGSTASDVAKLHNAGFQISGTPAASAMANAAGHSTNLVLTMGDNDGELDASWDPTPGAKVYEIQTSTNPLDATLWKPYGVPQTRSSIAITGLPSGQKMWVRVRAIGTSETAPGPWGDPAVKTVP